MNNNITISVSLESLTEILTSSKNPLVAVQLLNGSYPGKFVDENNKRLPNNDVAYYQSHDKFTDDVNFYVIYDTGAMGDLPRSGYILRSMPRVIWNTLPYARDTDYHMPVDIYADAEDTDELL